MTLTPEALITLAVPPETGPEGAGVGSGVGIGVGSGGVASGGVASGGVASGGVTSGGVGVASSGSAQPLKMSAPAIRAVNRIDSIFFIMLFTSFCGTVLINSFIIILE